MSRNITVTIRPQLCVLTLSGAVNTELSPERYWRGPKSKEIGDFRGVEEAGETVYMLPLCSYCQNESALR